MSEKLLNIFKELHEFYAEGYYELPDQSPFRRYSRGLRRYLEHLQLPEYNGASLYPCGALSTEPCVRHSYSYTMEVDWTRLRALNPEAAEALWRDTASASQVTDQVLEEHRVGGNLYTHSFPNFRRLVREGLNAYGSRIETIQNEALREGLRDVLRGIRSVHARALEILEGDSRAAELYHALRKVPFEPAETLYEAIVSWNFLYYMDGCDNIGRLDTDLIDFYRGEDMTEVLRQLFRNVDANNGWSGALGPDCNPLTVQCLKAVKGSRRPSLELRVTENTPAEVWNTAVETVLTGCGSPSFYNERVYQASLGHLFPAIPREDLLRTCGGGCTEMMLTGISNVGSLDAGVNLALIFERFMRKRLPEAADFEGFYEDFLAVCREEFDTVFQGISRGQELRAKYLPQPMRTLLIDDCIDREKDFNDKGARYRWSVVNIAGMINVLDSLLVIRKLVFEEKAMDGQGMLEALDQGETFLQFRNIPRHGTDSPEANALAARLSGDLCGIFEGKTPWAGGAFLPASIQFTTYVDAGRNVGPTPDGRRAGEPLCDSIGAIHSNDRRGVTALLNSCASMCLSSMAGTPVLNIRMEARQGAVALRPLIECFFRQGGMQVQVTCTRREELLAAQKDPDSFPNLIVRIGGYSEYFCRLTPELRQTVIDRTVYEV